MSTPPMMFQQLSTHVWRSVARGGSVTLVTAWAPPSSSPCAATTPRWWTRSRWPCSWPRWWSPAPWSLHWSTWLQLPRRDGLLWALNLLEFKSFSLTGPSSGSLSLLPGFSQFMLSCELLIWRHHAPVVIMFRLRSDSDATSVMKKISNTFRTGRTSVYTLFHYSQMISHRQWSYYRI